MSYIRSVVTAALVLALAACSSVPYKQRVSERQAAYTAAAGAPVQNFRFFTLYSWEPLGDNQLAIYTRPSEAWLLDVGACPDLGFVNSIGLTSNLNQVMVGFDRVLTGRGNFPCTISQIRPIDLKSLRAEQLKQREIKSQPREAEQQPAAQ